MKKSIDLSRFSLGKFFFSCALIFLSFENSEAQIIDSTWTRVIKFINQPMPAINGITIKGEKIDSNYFKNHVVLLSFANLINVGSLQQIPFLNQIKKDFEGKPVKILSVIPDNLQDVLDFNSNDNSTAEAARLCQTFNLPEMEYDVVAPCNIERASDVPLGLACDSIVKDYLIGGYPTTCLIDATGVIRYVHVAFAPKDHQQDWLSKVEGQIQVLLKSIPSGANYVLKNIFFETNSYSIRDESMKSLNELVDLLKQNSSLKIQIDGYTDDQGSDEYNLKLSESRAKAVYNYLIKNGIAAGRLSYKGFGKAKPIASNDTEDGRAQNRRIEFTVISN